MAADDGPQLAGQPHQGGDVEARLALGFIADFALALDHDDAFETRPVMALLQPSDIMDRRVGSGFDAAVIAIDGLMAADRGVLEAVRLLLGGEKLDVLAQRGLIALACPAPNLLNHFNRL